MAITSRQKLNTQNIGENPGILSRSISGTRCGGIPGRLTLLNISLGSNLSCLVRVILLHGQTVTFLALGPSIVEIARCNRERRDNARYSLFLEIPLPLQLPFYSALSELRVSLSHGVGDGQRKRQRLSTGHGSCGSPRRVESPVRLVRCEGPRGCKHKWHPAARRRRYFRYPLEWQLVESTL